VFFYVILFCEVLRLLSDVVNKEGFISRPTDQLAA